ncbi:MAG TPA: hypothetical protein VNC63_11105, partial [Propionibacteriaceae bacterium]|nr:hypothetical protein [Propionibacteriaceae bacterium]
MKVTRASAKAELSNQAKPTEKAKPSEKTKPSEKAKPSGTKKVPRSCSDVFRLWASVGAGILFTIAFEIVVIVLVVTGARPTPTD